MSGRPPARKHPETMEPHLDGQSGTDGGGVPHSARIRNHRPGGEDDFEIDRIVGEQVAREFQGRAVEARDRRRSASPARHRAAQGLEPVEPGLSRRTAGVPGRRSTRMTAGSRASGSPERPAGPEQDPARSPR
ncbi:SAM-dependent methyltransferase [Thermomonospora cellulosilytica]|uniref:Uncharacterized protein n=1 Tax=Thermomonospora cellulosilytica TaxID=1411118 RepID=A0A7W3R9N8_9ACTN|nr:SAM-dependent methyltransferase [Thermomonospora cellulosilytica]MBA9004829.1 hypothetical protein [Thermomonospora cellulosilytica]